MQNLDDYTAAIDEPKNARLEARTQQSVKDAISQAAALSGVELCAFVVSAAYKAAQHTIEANKFTILESKADQDTFFGALEKPLAPNSKLKQAFALRKEMIVDAD